MTFDEWWEKINKDHPEASENLAQIVKDIARYSWNASRNCPKCGKDLRWHVCPNCPGHDVEQYYNMEEEETDGRLD